MSLVSTLGLQLLSANVHTQGHCALFAVHMPAAAYRKFLCTQGPCILWSMRLRGGERAFSMQFRFSERKMKLILSLSIIFTVLHTPENALTLVLASWLIGKMFNWARDFCGASRFLLTCVASMQILATIFSSFIMIEPILKHFLFPRNQLQMMMTLMMGEAKWRFGSTNSQYRYYSIFCTHSKIEVTSTLCFRMCCLQNGNASFLDFQMAKTTLCLWSNHKIGMILSTHMCNYTDEVLKS